MPNKYWKRSDPGVGCCLNISENKSLNRSAPKAVGRNNNYVMGVFS